MTSTESTGISADMNNRTEALLPLNVVSEKDAEEKPWKFIGYPGFATFVSSDDDLLFFRKFGALHARVLLALQDELVQLVQALDEVDRKAITTQIDRHNGSFRQDSLHFPERTTLISNIHQKLKEYSELSSRGRRSNS